MICRPNQIHVTASDIKKIDITGSVAAWQGKSMQPPDRITQVVEERKGSAKGRSDI
jgi:hypothetical protein